MFATDAHLVLIWMRALRSLAPPPDLHPDVLLSDLPYLVSMLRWRPSA